MNPDGRHMTDLINLIYESIRTQQLMKYMIRSRKYYDIIFFRNRQQRLHRTKNRRKHYKMTHCESVSKNP